VEEQLAVAGLLLRIESEWDFSLPYAAMGEEEIHLEAEEAVEAVEVEEAEEHRLLRSLRPCLRPLSPKPWTSELWEPLQEYSKETERKQKIFSTNSDTTTVSIEGLLDSTLL
jgi:hypothetical protein